ncbi:glucose-6-phosphatase catalytic subunit 1-like [Coregonus clupeaformis]|uniref:glucose-6-phosphatase catalytic subunit 1-like n=1 Tax=Coregonus clupeaformis TaxID=59861 RepID=UPI001E1C83E3|nr:glucose-6-phosphatase catalytic subunit 1-like [Coregonus clupeaformis]
MGIMRAGLASTVADLHTTFFYFFPVWFHLCRDVGVKLIWVAVIGDWLNLVRKWVLFGERPYWWVHDTHFHGTDPAPALKQFPITCETGPGRQSGLLQVGLWMLLCTVELLVCMSRVYMAAHFPHQVISGVITGIMVAEVFSRVQWIYGASLKKYFYTTIFLLSFAVGFYVLLKALGVDLLWTLEKAQKWCVRPEWVHMDSTPFNGLLRNMSTLFGLGLGVHSPLYTESKKNSSTPFRAGCITVSLLLLQILDGKTFSSRNQAMFYVLSFSKSAAALFIPTALVPGGLSWIFPGKSGAAKLKFS